VAFITVDTIGCNRRYDGIDGGGNEIWIYNREMGTFYQNPELYNGRVTFSGGPIMGASHFYHTPSGNTGGPQWGFGMTIGGQNQMTWKESDAITPPYIDVNMLNSHYWGRICPVNGKLTYGLDVRQPRVCYFCGLHKETTPLSNNECMCFAGTFPGIDGACDHCPINTYKEDTSNDKCTTCPDNTYDSHDDRIYRYRFTRNACVCNAGYIGENGGTCSICAAGTYKSDSLTCLTCPSGLTTHAGSTGISACFCGAGTYKSDSLTCLTCPSGLTTHAGSTGISSCFCGAGFKETSTGACLKCVAGKHMPIGTSTCVLCPANTYQSEPNSLTCVQCTDFSSSQQGSESIAACECAPGYGFQSLSSTCVACTMGTFKSVIGNGNCQACPLFSTSSVGSIARSNCYCNANYYGTGMTQCLGCPLQSTSTTNSMNIAECACNSGYYGDFAENGGANSCKICSKGTYSKAGTGNKICTPCPPFSTTQFTESKNAADCTCVGGYYGHSSQCTQCPVGKFKQYEGYSNQCEICPDNSIALASLAADRCICNHRFTWTRNGKCVQCPATQYLNANEVCEQCPNVYSAVDMTQAFATGAVATKCVTLLYD